MLLLAEIPLSLRYLAVYLVGLVLGAVVNWAIYRLAWNQRAISPWGPAPEGAPPRKWTDRMPVVGWFGLRRESSLHGDGFWLRPFIIELLMPLALCCLFGWEVSSRGLVLGLARDLLELNLLNPNLAVPAAFPIEVVLWTFMGHTLLITLMTAVSFIDIDERIIPDEITVPGTLLGLTLATLLPMSVLPHFDMRDAQPPAGTEVDLGAGIFQNPAAASFYVEPVTLVSPTAWNDPLVAMPPGVGLAAGLGCWWLWCFALTPRIWRGRRGFRTALLVIARRVVRELRRPPLSIIALVGTAAIVGVWWQGGSAWMGLLTSLVGMVGAGGMIWAVRLIGTAALRKEAMGFGDVTLMMMVGTFVGWQAGVMIFFIAPFFGLIGGILQMVLHREDVIPYGPYLCLGTTLTIVRWSDIWSWADALFSLPWFVPVLLVGMFALLGAMLAVWYRIKLAMFASAGES